ncbi:MAG: tRNA (adenosine(37)-N6)-threonylcarbamoyltransferase complex transferase subunit TsaD [Patescibacteria group bacterium]
MKILSIETSCDETAIAIVDCKDGIFNIEKNLVASQIDIHAKYGGVVPEIAARKHVEILMPLLLESGIDHTGKGIDVIAVTYGPGLVPALRIGVELAKTLAYAWGKPLVGVNHMEGHLYSVLLDPVAADFSLRSCGKLKPSATSNSDFAIEEPFRVPCMRSQKAKVTSMEFPAVALLVSGGHTEIVYIKEFGQYEIVGQTRDDAAGEAFDKVAKLLGLEYPGGPVISKFAEKGNPEAVNFPRPMLDSKDFDFSFSGLKTAVSVYLKSSPKLSLRGGTLSEPKASRRGRRSKLLEKIASLPLVARNDISVEDICASFQEAVVETLVTKTKKAVDEFNPKSVILSGGVSANNRLREAFESSFSIPVFIPSIANSTDNAAMIAVAGYFHAKKKDYVDPLELTADPNLTLATLSS